MSINSLSVIDYGMLIEIFAETFFFYVSNNYISDKYTLTLAY